MPARKGTARKAAAHAAAAPATTPLSPDDVLKFVQECLEAHNKYRAMHGCPPLTLDNNMSAYATQWAKELLKRNKMEHRKSPKYGENIYQAGGFNINGENPVKLWYDEISKYNFAAAKFSMAAGHFTQLIWKSTKVVGIGIANKGNNFFVVANYDPPGNVHGEFKENVPKKST